MTVSRNWLAKHGAWAVVPLMRRMQKDTPRFFSNNLGYMNRGHRQTSHRSPV